MITVDNLSLGKEVLGFIKKQSEQAMESQSVSNISL